jgi:predicted glycoside hydrolase/deacetylase ChbG (UPF0249 family)
MSHLSSHHHIHLFPHRTSNTINFNNSRINASISISSTSTSNTPPMLQNNPNTPSKQCTLYRNT